MENWRELQEIGEGLGLPRAQGVEADIEEIAQLLNEPVGYLAMSNGDPSVVNCKVIGSGVRFFDFEAGCFRHALIDASVLRFFYPTGGPAWQLPLEFARQMEETYRAELRHALPRRENRFEKEMAAACAAWMLLRMMRLPKVDAGPDRDSWLLLPSHWEGPAPTRSRRRQLVSILETSVASLYRAQAFEALAKWGEDTLFALHRRWPEAAEPLPFYPAFR
jgi:hypothetical protein